MKKLLIALLAIGATKTLQAGPKTKDQTKEAREARMAQDDAKQAQKDADKENRKAEAAKQIPAATKKVEKLEKEIQGLEEERDGLLCDFKKARSDRRRNVDAYEAKENKEQVQQDYKDRFAASKHATPKEDVALTDEVSALHGYADTHAMKSIKRELRRVSHALAQKEKEHAEAREHERKLHVQAYKYDDLRAKEAKRAAKAQVLGHTRKGTRGASRTGVVMDTRISNDAKMREDARKEVRKEMGLEPNQNIPRPTCKQMDRHEETQAAKARMEKRSAVSAQQAEAEKAQREQDRKDAKAAKKEKFAKEKKERAAQAKADKQKADAKNVNKKAADKQTKQDKKAAKKADKKQAKKDKQSDTKKKGSLFNGSNSEQPKAAQKASSKKVKKDKQQEKQEVKAKKKEDDKKRHRYVNPDDAN